MIMYFSNKVQVKLNLLENFTFKNLWKKDRDWFFDFFRPSILKRALEIMYIQYIPLGIG